MPRKQPPPNMGSVISTDIFLCIFYKRDEEALRKVIRCFLGELGKEYDCADLAKLNEVLPLVGLRGLFLFLITADARLRYWTMQYETKSISKPPPKKVCLFLKELRDVIIPTWMSDERKSIHELVRKAAETYIRC
eukprot:3941797-Rhodomonas_salina.2